MTNLLPASTPKQWVEKELQNFYSIRHPRLGALGHGPAQGDADCSLLVRYLGYEIERGARSPTSVGIAWFHEVPYLPRHPHLARLFQESISEARKIRYETGLSEVDKESGRLVPAGRRSLAFALAKEVRHAGADRPLFIVVAQDARKEEAVELVRRELKEAIDRNEMTLLGTRGTIETIAQRLYVDELDRGWCWHELSLHRPVTKHLESVTAHCRTGALNLISLGMTSGEGDLDVAYYATALGQLQRMASNIWVGAIWLHAVPYTASRLHYGLHLQERLTTANIPYRTSIDGALDLLSDLKEKLSGREKAILIIVASDTFKASLRFVFRDFRDELLSRKVVVVATAGTAAILKDLAERGFP